MFLQNFALSCCCFFKKLYRDVLGDPMVKTTHPVQGGAGLSLVGELKSHMPYGGQKTVSVLYTNKSLIYWKSEGRAEKLSFTEGCQL